MYALPKNNCWSYLIVFGWLLLLWKTLLLLFIFIALCLFLNFFVNFYDAWIWIAIQKLVVNSVQVILCQKHSHSCINWPKIWQIVQGIMSSVQENYKFSKCCVQQIVFCFCFDIQNMYWTCNFPVIFLYWTCNSTNNLSSYFGVIDAWTSASDKDLPVCSILCHTLVTNTVSWVWVLSRGGWH